MVDSVGVDIDTEAAEVGRSKTERARQKLEDAKLAVAVTLIALAGVDDQWYGDDQEWEYHNLTPTILAPTSVKARSQLSGGWFTLENDALTLMMPTFRAALVERGWENVEERKWAMPNSKNALSRGDVVDGDPFQWAEGWQRRVSLYPDEVRSVMRALREDIEWAQDQADAWKWATDWIGLCKNTVEIARYVLLKPKVWNNALS